MTAIIIAGISGVCVAVPSIIATVVTNRKNKDIQIETRKLTIYRIDQLEKKVDKHNSMVERTYKLEGEVQELQNKLKI